MRPSLGILGGSGFYEIDGLEEVETIEMVTPFGSPSAPVVTGQLNGKPVAFISRHGNGHQFFSLRNQLPREYLCAEIVGSRAADQHQCFFIPAK